jgi:DNA replication protein DnaC
VKKERQKQICEFCEKEIQFESVTMAGVPFRLPSKEGHEECIKQLAEKRANEEKRFREAERVRWVEERISAGFAGANVSTEGKTFAQFKQDQGNASALTELQSWRFPEKGICLMGSPGTGKTHLMVALAMHCGRELHMPFRFLCVPDWTDLLRTGDFQTTEALITNASEIPILFLDDLGAEHVTDFVEAKLCRVLNARAEFKRPTFISTNLREESMQKLFTERTFSRLHALAYFVLVDSIDRRIER